MLKSYYSRSFSILLLIIDLVLINIAFILAFSLRFERIVFDHREYLALLALIDLIWIIASLFNNVYLFSKVTQIRHSTLKLIGTFLLHGFLVSLIFVAFKEYDYSRLVLTYTYIISAISIFSLRVVYFLITKQYYRSGVNAKQCAIIGDTPVGRELYKFFQNGKSGYKFVGYFDDIHSNYLPRERKLGSIDDIEEVCRRRNINELYYAKDLTNVKLISRLTDYVDQNFKFLKFIPDFRGLQKSKFEISFYGAVPVVNYTQAPLSGFFNQKIKRAFDVVFSLAVLSVLVPFVFPIIALLIKSESKGPVFFKQMRPGKGNKLFSCYKFRTMKVNGNTEKQATKNDPRITKIGAFLRKTSLDELPQFINALKGDMSIVGPRPNLISQLEYYSKEIDKYNFRHFITPGITGYAQVNGFRGETKDIELMKKRVEYDAWYIENWSLTLDIKIIIMTAWRMITGDDAAY